MADNKEGTKLWTPRFDARFPNVNQTKNCWQNYVDYHACVNAGGESCEYYKKVFTSLCPTEWVCVYMIHVIIHVSLCRLVIGMTKERQAHFQETFKHKHY